MEVVIIFFVMLGLMLLRVPVAFSMGLAAVVALIIGDIPLTLVPQRMFGALDSFPLLAIPLFTLAGSLMNDSGISERLFGFTRAFVGHIRGGMAHTAIVGNIFMAGISGSSVADCAATSRVFVPQLAKAGYGPGFAAAVCAACAAPRSPSTTWPTSWLR